MNSPDPVKDAYERAWTAIESSLDRQIEAGESSLSRLLHVTLAENIGPRPRSEAQSVLYGVAVPSPYLAANRIIRDWIADTVIETANRVEVSAIAETGSGWGYNLMNAYVRGAPHVPLHALEYTEAGRRCSEKLSDIAQRENVNLRVHSFDYHAPVFSPIVGRYSKLLVFTSHSIEQIAELPEAYVDRLCDAADEVRVLHFEPVGWQAVERMEDGPARRHGRDHRYNTNLLPLLNAAHARGQIEILRIERDVMAAKTFNPTTLVEWRSRPW